MDHFSKWTEAWPIRNHEAVTVARILSDQLFARFGIPLQLLSDRGTEFESQLMRELCIALGIDKLRTTAYKPSTNGALERFHRTMNSMLAKVVSENQRDWDERLQSVLCAYRASPQESTGFSPNFVLLGRECRAPLDLVLGPPDKERDRWGSSDEYVYHQQCVKRDAYRLVREHLGVAAERSKTHYDMRVRPAQFQVGEWVYVYYPRRYVGRNVKWSHFYTGPFLIVKQLNAVNYVVQRTAKAKSQVVHVDKLKKCGDTSLQSWLDESTNRVQRVDPNEAAAQRPVDSHRTDIPVPGVVARQRSPTMVSHREHEPDGQYDSEDEDGVNTRPPLRRQPPRQAPIPHRYIHTVTIKGFRCR